jgi:MinD-like ATPase involved in chromosome partitioning or flagellar assembly
VTTPILVVAGAPGLAKAFNDSRMFGNVLTAVDEAELLGLVRGEKLAGKKPGDVVFFVADTLPPTPQMPLADFLRRVTGAGYRTVVLAVTAKGSDLQRQAPQCGLLPVPVTLNNALFALNTFGYACEPHPEGFAEIDLTGTTTPPAAAQPAAQAPAQPEAQQPVKPSGGGWRKPTDPAAPITTRPAAQPDVPAPAPAPAPAPQPYAPAPAPSPEPAPAPFSPAPAPAPAPAPFSPAPAPAPAPAPFSPAPEPAPAPTPFSPAPAPFSPAPAPFSPAPAADPYAPQTNPYQTPAPSGPYQPDPYNTPAPTGMPTGMPVGYPQPGGGPVLRDGAQAGAPRPGGRRGFVIAITTSKGGTGKSSLAINAAAFLGMKLRAQGRTVCLVDANIQQADAGKYLNTFSPNIVDVAKDPQRYSRPEALAGVLTHFSAYNMSVLLGPKSPDEGSPTTLTPELYTNVVNTLRNSYDVVLIDLPVAEKFHRLFADFALPIADYILVPVIPNMSTLLNADLWLKSAVVSTKAAGGAGKDRNQVGIVLNRAEEGIGCSTEQARAALSNWNFLGAIPESKQWKAANNSYELVVAKNFPELNRAFSEIFYQVTGEPALAPQADPNIEEPEKKSFVKSLLERRKKDH